MDRITKLLQSIPQDRLVGSVIFGSPRESYILFEKRTQWLIVQSVKSTIEEHIKRHPEDYRGLWVKTGEMEVNGLKYIEVKES